MLDWNPALYRRYEDERTRPAQELLARVPLTEAARVVDLGCGPGNSTELLVHRFPKAQVLGTDNSEAMLASARARLPQAGFELSNIATWAPRSSEEAPDLIYANASLQWVPDHEKLIPRLFDALAPGGVLAIQMPDNRQEPTHSLMRALGPKRRGPNLSGTLTACAPCCWSWVATTTCWRRVQPVSMSGAPSTSTPWLMPLPSSNGYGARASSLLWTACLRICRPVTLQNMSAG